MTGLETFLIGAAVASAASTGVALATRPKTPSPPPIPPPPTKGDAETQAAADRARKLFASQSGRSSTILGGSSSATDDPFQKSLLGQ